MSGVEIVDTLAPGALGAGEPVWLRIARADAEAALEGLRAAGAPAAFVDALGSGRDRTDPASAADHGWAVLAFHVAEPSESEVEHAIFGAIRGRLLVTIGGERRLAGVDAGAGVADTAAAVLVRLNRGTVHALDATDDAADRAETRALDDPTDRSVLRDLSALRLRVRAIRRTVSLQRFLVEEHPDALHYAEGGASGQVAPTLERLDRRITITQESLAEAVTVALSSSSNRLGSAANTFAIVATLFLPLTFVASFFGQNFRELTEFIDGPWEFWLFGVVLPVGGLAALFGVLWLRGLIGSRGAAGPGRPPAPGGRR